MAEGSRLGVALVGCGTVGGATAALLTADAGLLAARAGTAPELRHIVDRDFTNARRMKLPESLFRTDLSVALNDPAVGAVIELVGGTTFAKDVIARALNAGKHVVTANKALLAHHGLELWSLARSKGLCIAFEASCGGGIPIIRALYDGLIANRIDAIYGIVNGTCNYILTAMTSRGQTYAEALAEAQKQGLAEADPTLDVSGMDSAHKLTILAGLAFGQKIDLASIPVAGIDSLQLRDIQYGQELGYVVKLLAIAYRQGEGICLRVRPAFISKNHPLAWVSGPFNAVSVYGHATGHTMYFGRGAGGKPTASAVVADIVSLATGTAQAAFTRLGIWPDRAETARQLPGDVVRSRHYLRIMAEDEPGVLAACSAAFGRHGISIRSVLQHETPAETMHRDGVPVVITTHTCSEGAVRGALAEIDALGSIKSQSVCIDMVDEYPEQL